MTCPTDSKPVYGICPDCKAFIYRKGFYRCDPCVHTLLDRLIPIRNPALAKADAEAGKDAKRRWTPPDFVKKSEG